MKSFILSVLVVTVLFAVPNTRAQQWSDDPVIDALKQSMADEIKAQEVIDYCEQDANRHKKMCDGVNDHQKSTFMSYDQALKFGQKQLAEQENAKKANVPAPPLSLAEYAEQQRLRTQVTSAIYDYCAKHSDTEAINACKDKPTLIESVLVRTEKKLSVKKKSGDKPTS
jgi:hypothetical protein